MAKSTHKSILIREKLWNRFLSGVEKGSYSFRDLRTLIATLYHKESGKFYFQHWKESNSHRRKLSQQKINNLLQSIKEEDYNSSKKGNYITVPFKLLFTLKKETFSTWLTAISMLFSTIRKTSESLFHSRKLAQKLNRSKFTIARAIARLKQLGFCRRLPIPISLIIRYGAKFLVCPRLLAHPLTSYASQLPFWKLQSTKIATLYKPISYYNQNSNDPTKNTLPSLAIRV